MIQTDKLIAAIRDRVRHWQLVTIVFNEKNAKKIAARVFIEALGVRVTRYKTKGYAVWQWKRRPYNGK